MVGQYTFDPEKVVSMSITLLVYYTLVWDGEVGRGLLNRH